MYALGFVLGKVGSEGWVAQNTNLNLTPNIKSPSPGSARGLPNTVLLYRYVKSSLEVR